MIQMHAESLREVPVISDSALAREIRDEVECAARSDAKVLITGERGSGKEIVARVIHQRSQRWAAPLATLSCAGVLDSQLESALFGRVDRSFGFSAARANPGVCGSAPDGTVFLDEVGELSVRLQARLLRFLETGEIRRVGAERVTTRANVRLIAATNLDLVSQMHAGRFSDALYYRL